MKCWKCGTDLPDPPMGKLPFRALCDRCSAWLHCCKNCRNYHPGLPNDCAVPGTEYIADREAVNFCEEFQLLGLPPAKTADPNEVAKKLFKDSASDQPKRTNFDNLFSD
jgi:hypothetical protein